MVLVEVQGTIYNNLIDSILVVSTSYGPIQRYEPCRSRYSLALLLGFVKLEGMK